MRHHTHYYRGPAHIPTAEQPTWGVSPDLTITRYTEDCEERLRTMQHLVVRNKDNLCTLLLTSVVQPHQYFIQITVSVCSSVCHGCDALPICGPISGYIIVSATVTLPHFRVIASAFKE